jgi:hypothetical protein
LGLKRESIKRGVNKWKMMNFARILESWQSDQIVMADVVGPIGIPAFLANLANIESGLLSSV